LTTLQFHKVPADAPDVPLGELPKSAFIDVLDVLAETMHVMPLGEAIAELGRGRLPPRAVALTFDDGYPEWCEHVAQALRQRSMHATFFVTTGQLDSVGMWHERIDAAVAALPAQGAQLPEELMAFRDLSRPQMRLALARLLQEELKYQPLAQREAAIVALEQQGAGRYAAPRAFSAEHVRALHAAGFAIGAHTVNHPILSAVDDATAYDEIARSREVLSGLIGGPVDLFAYPNGRPGTDFAARHVDMVRASGYRAAVVTGGGVAGAGCSPFMVPRFTPWPGTPLRTSLRLARNLTQVQGADDAALGRRPTRVLLVENGAGFGGAMVAAGTLVRHANPGEWTYDVVSNAPWLQLKALPALRSHRVLNNRRVNFRLGAAWARRALPVPLARTVGFALGRLDDLCNRAPYLARLWWTAWRLSPDIVHGNNEPNSNREAMLVARWLGVPYVQHLRGPYPHTRLLSRLLGRPSCFLPVSRWLAGALLADGVEAPRVRQIYDGFELPPALSRVQARQALEREFGLVPGQRCVAMAGMLVAWKGQDLFLRAAEALCAERSDVVFFVVGAAPALGDATYPAALKQQARALEAAGRVIFTGHRDDIAALMPAMDVLVSASLEPEPLGLVMLEGLAAGCQFVGPEHGAAVEVTRLLGQGTLFEPGNATALKQAMSVALVAAEKTGAAPDALRQQLAELFAPALCARRTAKAYALARSSFRL
jgi:glycosyltransferase involved in cell wall biosynthesis/peptidoglycan/xylan/chitin deacetylase (PgdA/CDA1 family)